MCISLFNPFSFYEDKDHYDKYKLIRTDQEITPSEVVWYLNLALLRDAYERTDNPELKKQIRFLATNYLAKATPVAPLQLKIERIVHRFTSDDLENLFQVGVVSDYMYHRTSYAEASQLKVDANHALALGNKSPLIPTDTVDVDILFPLHFVVVFSEETQKEWVDTFIQTYADHLDQFPDKVSDALKKSLNHPILFDLTERLSALIETNHDEAKEQQFNLQIDVFKKELNATIDFVVESLIDNYPELQEKEHSLRRHIQNNIITVCRIQTDTICGIKVLPIFTYSLEGDRLKDKHPKIIEFLGLTGAYIGAVNLRREIHDGFAAHPNVYYAVEGPNAIYFENRTDFLQLNLFKRLLEKFNSNEVIEKKPHVVVLGTATLRLLAGIFQEMTEAQWKALNADPAKRMLVQTCLYKIKEALSSAELQFDQFSEFTKSIEIVHCEMTTLLELTMPFTEADFAEIYKSQLRVVPKALKPYVETKLGKTAVNLFAGANIAISRMHEHPVCTYSKGFYFEQIDIAGYDNEFDKVIANPAITRVDLYGGQFSPNLTIEADHRHYKFRNIGDDVEQILTKKTDTKHLTVMVDCTIDFFNSSKVQDLLNRFEKEILEGKLNFIFFSSGQKTDMMGLDNYYGARIFMINNKGPQWEQFRSLLQEEVFKTDPLSLQWFALSIRYAIDYIDAYRSLIFDNTRKIYRAIKPSLLANAEVKQHLRMSTFDGMMDPAFFDIKVVGPAHRLRCIKLLGQLYKKCYDNQVKIHTRASFGFNHINSMIVTTHAVPDVSTMRINPSINPEENAVLISFFNSLSPKSRF